MARSVMATSGTTVAVRALRKSFGPVKAVDGVDLDVAAGEFVALLGPSGSGKTTILMSTAGFETPDSGRILIGGKDVTGVAPNKRDIGMVFQRYALFPHMTVAENIAFPLKMRNVDRRATTGQVEAALAMVRLEGYGARRISQLSGGQQQRVALARALVYHPPLLLMDEPLGALDKNLREEMQLEIKRLQKKLGTTVIYVTHDQSEALTMADRIAVMNDGRIQQYASPKDVYDRPANAFVAGFVGETNFVDGALAGGSGAWRFGIEGSSAAVDVVPPEGDGGGWRHGAAARLAIRPELVRVGNAEEAGPTGTVEEVIYSGGTVVCLVRISAGAVMTARLPADVADLQEGARVKLVWPHHRARVFLP